MATSSPAIAIMLAIEAAMPSTQTVTLVSWRFNAALGARILNGGNSAYYRLDSDHIQMPPFERFFRAEGYYATLAPEATHWTRHPSRLDRSFERQRFGDEGYAKEELVAELGAAFLCADLELRLGPAGSRGLYRSLAAGTAR